MILAHSRRVASIVVECAVFSRLLQCGSNGCRVFGLFRFAHPDDTTRSGSAMELKTKEFFCYFESGVASEKFFLGYTIFPAHSSSDIGWWENCMDGVHGGPREP
jgi:hypothetical protein